jgi:hypothetical protein
MSNIIELKEQLETAKTMVNYHSKQAASYQQESEILTAELRIARIRAARKSKPLFTSDNNATNNIVYNNDYGNGEHTHGPNFGKYVPGCSRCDELKNGATPKQGRCAASRGY